MEKLKKLTDSDMVIILADSISNRNKNPELRNGQSLFNSLHKFHPEIADKITATKVDPFYNDNLIKDFFDAIYLKYPTETVEDLYINI